MAVQDALLQGTRHLIGILLALCGTLIISLSGVLSRQIEQANSWQIIFYRSIGLFFGLSILFVIRNPGRARRVFMAGVPKAIVAGPFQAAASVLFILALMHTTIANAVLMLAATPLITACLGSLFLNERIHIATVLAMIGVLVGIGLMTAEGFVSGAAPGSIY